MKMQGELALVTGASSGIGKELARELARRKIDLVLTARRRERLEELRAELIAAHGIQVTCLEHDLDDPRSGEKLVATLQQQGLEISLLVNNAGFGWYGESLQQTDREVESMLHVNLLAVTALTRLLTTEMVARGRGRVLNVASMIAITPAAGMTLYSATKAYILSFSQTLDLELAPHGVRVSVLCPGFTATEFNEMAHWPKSWLMNFLMLKAPHVARAGVAGVLRGKRLIIPGWHFKLTAFVVRFLPRSLVLRLAAEFCRSPVVTEGKAES